MGAELCLGIRPPPNGSRLSCGRNARGRKEGEPQTRGWPARQRNSSLLVSARQLQALVRQPAFLRWDPTEPAALAHDVVGNRNRLARPAARGTDAGAGVSHWCKTGNAGKASTAHRTRGVDHAQIVSPRGTNRLEFLWIIPCKEDELSAGS
jgi:hypothetical protein